MDMKRKRPTFCGACRHRLTDGSTEGRGRKLGQLEELQAEGHADDGTGERNARNEEAHRKRYTDKEKPEEVSNRALVEVDLYLGAARPCGKMRDAEAATAPRDKDDSDTTKDAYQEKGNGHGKAVKTKPENVDNRIHCENLSLEMDARKPRAIIHINFIIDKSNCQWKKQKTFGAGINFVFRCRKTGEEIDFLTEMR